MPLIKQNKKLVPQADPRQQPYYTEPQIQALRALNREDAGAQQQRVALDFIIQQICGTYDMVYRKDTNDTLIAEGKRIAGLHIIELLKYGETNREGESDG